MNLSAYSPNIFELKILSKGLKFIPTLKSDPIEIEKDILLFQRRLKLIQHFKDDGRIQEDKFNTKANTGWTPNINMPNNLICFMMNVESDILNIKSKEKQYPNLTKKEFKAIKTLRDNDSIVIRKADKGGKTVILNKNNYIKEANRQLQNRNHYRPLAKDNTVKTNKEVKDYITQIYSEGHINEETARYLKPKNPRTPIFYMLPKIHKPNNPGRPIISQVNSPTERISEFLDYHLKPIATKNDSYLKDTNDFLNRLHNLEEIPEKTILVTIDVVSLYTNIPHEDGIEATRKAFDSREDKQLPTEILIKLLELVLKRTTFKFNGKHYEQKQGTTMGTKMAVMYAIQTVADLEQSFLKTQTLLPLVWWRFIDDIFALWTWGADLLFEFLEELNQFHPTLKFTAEFSDESVNFLDVKVIKVGNKLHTTLYNKPTDAHLYLEYSSCHPKHQRNNIPTAQALRIRKICSREEDCDYHLKRLFNHFKNRHYPEEIIKKAIENAMKTTRKDLLANKQRTRSAKIIPFTVTYNPNLTKVTKILHQHIPILHSQDETKRLANYKIITAFRRAKNLADIMIRNDITPAKKKESGSQKCGKNCITCKYIVPTKEAFNKNRSFKYTIHQYLDCNSTSVVYLLWCNICNIQYIGQTSMSLKERMYGHRNDIKSANQFKPVSQHFTLPDHSAKNLNVTPLRMTKQNDNERLRYEEVFIRKFKTLTPNGLNQIW